VLEIVEASLGTEFGPDIAECYLSLHRADAIPRFDSQEYRHTVLRAGSEGAGGSPYLPFGPFLTVFDVRPSCKG
jgi:hypothetical protein